ncbi:MAG: hypothetical protein FJ263_08880 [Planctomycetes bacterium]|nr:hypothetical protein [Planctomycetota bacterium]
MVVDFVTGGAEITITVAGVTVYDKYFIAGMTPYGSRVAFGGRTSGTMTTLYLDNISVAYETPTTTPPAPVSFRTFNQKLMNGSFRTVKQTFSFPAAAVIYERVILKLTLAKPADGWDPWDRMMGIYMWNSGNRYEIARFMTPYSKAGSWWIDVTDYQGLLTGSQQMEMWLDSWVSPNGYLITTDFYYYEGDPQYRVLGGANLWIGTPTYGVLTDPTMSSFFTDKNVSIPSNAVKVKLHFMVTGHGQKPNSENAAEFISRGRTVTVNGNTFYNVLWRNDCYLNPCRNQSGTWKYSRAGWAPGDRVWPWDIDITTVVVPGQTSVIDYSADPYYNYTPDTSNNARHWVASQIIYYGTYTRPVTPYISINDGALQQTANAELQVNDSITFSPQPTYYGSWNWTGPNGFTAATRQITLNNIQPDQAGTYTAVYTSSSGTQSTQAHVITVSYWNPTAILNDGFEAGSTLAMNGWTVSSGAAWLVDLTGGNPGKYAYGGGSSSVKANLNSGVISKSTGYVIVGDEMLWLSFDIKRMTTLDFDGAIFAKLYYYDDSSNIVVLGSAEYHENLFASVGWYSVGDVYAVPTAASVGKTLYVSFEGGPSSWNGLSAQQLGIDNVRIRRAVYCDMTDINYDTQVDIEDLMIFCQAWLDVSPDETVDLWPDNIANLNDFLFFSTCWNR